jgi:hypothetical protein
MMASKGLGIVIDVASAAAWGFGGYVLGSRFISDQAGGVLGLAVFLSLLALSLGTALQELRMERLVAGTCPRCRASVAYEHRHRRWEGSRNAWLAPMTSWECRDCGFSHNEAWACPACPVAD